MTRWTLLLLGLMSTAPLAAEGFDWRRLYLGVGLGSASISQLEEEPNALQYFIGYPLLRTLGAGGVERFQLGLEAGYTGVSDYDYDSYWVAPVASYGISSELNVLLRAGIEQGDSSGVMGAAGITYLPDPVFGIRLELVEREDSSLAMINLVYRP